METATKNLEKDHVYILKLIDIMEESINNGETDYHFFEKIIWVIREYADGFHHAKEENLLFPLMTQRGFSLEQGPIAVMLHDHVTGRNYVKGMAENLEKFKNGDKLSISQVYNNMLGYIELLRSHIAKENNILFRMADNALNQQDQQNLLEQFDRIEKTAETGKTLNDFIAQIDDLNKKIIN